MRTVAFPQTLLGLYGMTTTSFDSEGHRACLDEMSVMSDLRIQDMLVSIKRTKKVIRFRIRLNAYRWPVILTGHILPLHLIFDSDSVKI